MKQPKKEPWRIAAAAVSVTVIVLMWVRKGIGAQLGALPAEQLLPMALTSAAVTLIKVAMLAAAVLVLRRIIARTKK